VAAISEYHDAWKLVPDPKNHWRASTCPDGIGNPFLHLRYGQILLDKGGKDRVADELMRAYMGGGSEIFALEDPRYLAFLTTRAII
jgi:hypothetical protein